VLIYELVELIYSIIGTCIKKGKQPNATASLDSEDLWSSISKYITNEGIEPGSESVLKENRLGIDLIHFHLNTPFRYSLAFKAH
jgi:hypothetical protein